MPIVFNPIECIFEFNRQESGGASAIVEAEKAPKLIVTFDTDTTTAIGDLVVVSGSDFVSTINDNMASSMPNGIFGVVTAKPSTTEADVIFVGVQEGYSGFTTGSPIFVENDGTPGHDNPGPGDVGRISQQIGFAVSSSAFFIYLGPPYERT